MLNISIDSADKETRACSEICILTITSHIEFKTLRMKRTYCAYKRTSRLRKNVELIVKRYRKLIEKRQCFCDMLLLRQTQM